MRFAAGSVDPNAVESLRPGDVGVGPHISLSGFSVCGHFWVNVMRSDDELLRAWVTVRSQSAFAELVERHGAAVYGSALRQTGRPDLAEEVVQAVFILLARKAAGLRPGVVLVGWLFRAAHFAAQDLLRSERRRREREIVAHAMNSLESTSPATDDPQPLWDRVAPRLDDCLARLGEADRHAILLRFFENRSLREVGQALGIAEDAARKRVARALERLQVLLVRQGAPVTAEDLHPLLLSRVSSVLPAGLAASTVAAVMGQSGSPGLLALTEALARRLWWWSWKGWSVAGAVMVAGTLGVGMVQWPEIRSALVRAEARSSTDDYSIAGFHDAEAVHTFILRVQQALLQGEGEALVGLVGFPLRVNGPDGTEYIESPDALRGRVAEVFPPDVTRLILKCPRTQLHCEARGVMIGSGQAWITPQTLADGTREPRLTVINRR